MVGVCVIEVCGFRYDYMTLLSFKGTVFTVMGRITICNLFMIK